MLRPINRRRAGRRRDRGINVGVIGCGGPELGRARPPVPESEPRKRRLAQQPPRPDWSPPFGRKQRSARIAPEPRPLPLDWSKWCWPKPRSGRRRPERRPLRKEWRRPRGDRGDLGANPWSGFHHRWRGGDPRDRRSDCAQAAELRQSWRGRNDRGGRGGDVGRDHRVGGDQRLGGRGSRLAIWTACAGFWVASSRMAKALPDLTACWICCRSSGESTASWARR